MRMEKRFLPELIVAPRVSLKRLNADLAQKMFEYIVEDRIRLSRFLPWPQAILTVNDEIDFVKRCNESWEKQESASYGIFRNNDNEYMGNINAFSFNWTNESCEIGYWILGKFEGHGYMSEAVTALEKTLFNTGFNRIVIRFDPQNKRSGSIPNRLGYHDEGTLRQAIKVDNTFRDLKVFSKIKADLLKT